MTVSNKKPLADLMGCVSITPNEDNSFSCIDCESGIFEDCENCNGTGIIPDNRVDDPADIIEKRDWLYGI